MLVHSRRIFFLTNNVKCKSLANSTLKCFFPHSRMSKSCRNVIERKHSANAEPRVPRTRKQEEEQENEPLETRGRMQMHFRNC